MPVTACELLTFENAWIREPPPVSKVAAGYLVISNPQDVDISITDINADCCHHLMFHETITENGNSRMHHLNDLVVPGNSQIKLAPLGKHLMLMGLKQNFVAGNSIEISFSCDSADHTKVFFAIQKSNN